MNKYSFTLFVMTLFLMLSACGAGNGSTSVQSGSGTIPTADFFKLAIVPNQTVSASTFEVQVIAELLNPNAGTLAAPSVLDNGGTAHTMTAKVLQWPGTVENSITVWSATVPLVSDQVNSLIAVSGTKTIAFSIKHKTTLSILTAFNSTDLLTHIKAAIVNPTIDVIQVAYNETNLGGILQSVGTNIINARSYWMTVEPANGNTLTWNRDTGAALGRPYVDWMHLKGVVYGSDTSDNAAGTYYVEANHHVWLSNSQFRGKYKYTWGKNTPITAPTVADIRTSLTEGQQVYLTDCLWDGTAEDAATSYVQLARDLRFISHRGDINNFGKVVLNMYAQDIETVRNSTDTDYFHNDGFQIWGGVQTNDIVFKGLKIVSPNVPADIQPFLLDYTFTPNYSYILMDSVIIVGAASNTVLQANAAGKISNSRISNYSFPNQHLAFRYDLPGTNGAFSPTNVYISNMEAHKVLYVAPTGGTSITYDYLNVNNTNNISIELSANPALSGVSFTNIKVLSGP